MKTGRVSFLDAGLLVIRIALGIVFVFHGAQKLFGAFDGPGLAGFGGHLETLGVPAPTFAAVLSALTEFVGGLALILGFALRIVVVPMVFNMLVAIVMVHPSAFSLQKNGMEYALTLGLVLLGLGLTGPGRLALRMRRRRSRGREGASTRASA